MFCLSLCFLLIFFISDHLWQSSYLVIRWKNYFFSNNFLYNATCVDEKKMKDVCLKHKVVGLLLEVLQIISFRYSYKLVFQWYDRPPVFVTVGKAATCLWGETAWNIRKHRCTVRWLFMLMFFPFARNLVCIASVLVGLKPLAGVTVKLKLVKNL